MKDSRPMDKRILDQIRTERLIKAAQDYLATPIVPASSFFTGKDLIKEKLNGKENN